MIGVYHNPESMSREQYEQIGEKLEAAKAPTEGMKVHTCFGEEGNLMVFEVWDSQEHYEAEATFLFPILDEVGIKLAHPTSISPILRLDIT